MNQNEELFYYSIKPTEEFNNNVKYYIKKKKFTKLPTDIKGIIENLEKGIFDGDIIGDLDLGDNQIAHKVRAVNSNTNVGKLNGYRLIYLVEENDKVVFLVTIYYKKEDNNIPSDAQIREIIKKYCI